MNRGHDDHADLAGQLDRAGEFCQARHPGWETLLDRLPPQVLPADPPQPAAQVLPGSARAAVVLRWLGWAAVAAGACAVVAVGVWQYGPPETASLPPVPPRAVVPLITAPREPVVTLAAGCRIEPVREASYQVVGPRRVQLRRGELYVEIDRDRSDDEPFVVETPAGEAKAVGTRFLVETQSFKPDPKDSPQPQGVLKMASTLSRASSLTRVLVLAGVVQLVNTDVNLVGRSGQVLAADTLKAQEQPAHWPPSHWMLHSEHTRKEINLTPEQAEKLKELGKQYFEQNQQAYAKYDWAKLSPEQRKAKMAEITEFYKKQAEVQRQRIEETRKKVESILKPDQLQKLEMIEMRNRGVSYLGIPQVAQALELSEEQKEKLKKNQQEFAEKMRQIQQESAEAAMKVLSPSQLEQFKRLHRENYQSVFKGPRGAGQGGLQVNPAPAKCEKPEKTEKSTK